MNKRVGQVASADRVNGIKMDAGAHSEVREVALGEWQTYGCIANL